MHLAEQYWRRVRKGFADQFEAMPSFLKMWEKGVGRVIPEEVAVPWMAAYVMGRMRSEQLVAKFGPGAAVPLDTQSHAADTLAFFAAYRETKRVYRIEERLIECLQNSSWPLNLPCEAIHLPVNGLVLDLPNSAVGINDGGRALIGCFLDLRSGHETEPGLELRILKFHDVETVPVYGLASIDLTLPSLQEAFANQIERQRRFLETNRDRLPDAARWDISRTRPEFETTDPKRSVPLTVLTILLYLAGNEDVVETLRPGARPAKTSKNPEKQRRFQDLAEPREFVVGQEFVSTLDRAEREAEEGVREGRSVRPHLRAAHAALYWTGPGRKTPRVKFLLPIHVKGGVKGPDGEATASSTVKVR